MYKFYFILFLVSAIQLNAQESRHPINGKVQRGNSVIENVHVINKTSNRGTISNKNGDFKIKVKENDTLQFSNIQYKTKRIIIKKIHLQNGNLKVSLIQRTNKLEEIVIVKPKNMAVGLGLPNAGKEPLKPIERKLNYINKGGNIDKLYAWISGNKKKLEILQKRLNEDEIALDNKVNVQLIRNHFKEDFFIYTLKISSKKIDGLIHFCLANRIVYLFENERYMEIIDIFIKNKDAYLSSLGIIMR